MIKLHLGCGRNKLSGWTNTDFDAKRHGEYLNVTEEFPYQKESVDYIFSEHLIEHITYQEGNFMLDECYRVLKPGGKIRIATPDLKFLIELYNKDKTELQEQYIKYSYERYGCGGSTDTFVINNFVRDWGHLFIYDEKTLKDLVELVGFSDIKSYPLLESDDEQFRGLENVSRQPTGFLALETFVLEGTKK